jgi:hypothetical protein
MRRIGGNTQINLKLFKWLMNLFFNPLKTVIKNTLTKVRKGLQIGAFQLGTQVFPWIGAQPNMRK